MSELDGVAWPAGPIETEHRPLREPEARAQGALLGLLSDPEVDLYIGGTRSRDDLNGTPAQGRPPTADDQAERHRTAIVMLNVTERGWLSVNGVRGGSLDTDD